MVRVRVKTEDGGGGAPSPAQQSVVTSAAASKLRSWSSNAATQQQQGKLANDGKKKSSTSSLNQLCAICDASGLIHHNFGVVSCNSCRAFFRRTSTELRQKEIQLTDLRCLGGASNEAAAVRCVIGPETFGKMCRQCRYRKCLEKGMRAEQVLSEDDKRYRFRRVFKQQSKSEESSSKAKLCFKRKKNMPQAAAATEEAAVGR